MCSRNQHEQTKDIILACSCNFAFLVLQECMNSLRKIRFSFSPSLHLKQDKYFVGYAPYALVRGFC